jgi:hypothetical protein
MGVLAELRFRVTGIYGIRVRVLLMMFMTGGQNELGETEEDNSDKPGYSVQHRHDWLLKMKATVTLEMKR